MHVLSPGLTPAKVRFAQAHPADLPALPEVQEAAVSPIPDHRPSAEVLKANYLRFGAEASGDEALIASLHPHLQKLVPFARQAAVASNSSAVTAEHLVFAAGSELKRLLNNRNKNAEEVQLQDALLLALFPNARKTNMSQQDMADLLDGVVNDLAAKFQEEGADKPAVTAAALDPTLRMYLEKVAKTDSKLQLSVLFQVFRMGESVNPGYATVGQQLSALDQTETNLVASDILAAFQRHKPLFDVYETASRNALYLTDANSSQMQLTTLMAGWLQLAREVDKNATVLTPGARLTLQQQKIKLALDALLPPEVRKDASLAEISSALQAADTRLRTSHASARKSPQEVQKDHKAMLTALYRFANDGQRTDFSPGALVDYLSNTVPKAVWAPGDASLVADTINGMRKNLNDDRLKEVERLKAQMKSAPTKPEDYQNLLDEQFRQPNSSMTPEQYIGIQKLIDKFKGASEATGDKAKYKQRLDYALVDLKWLRTQGIFDSQAVRAKLDEDHYGLDKPKHKLTRNVAVRARQQRMGLKPSSKIICLVGPPGVGKTSLASSVAAATGRTMCRVALGGVNDEADIRGHRSTYVGALAGRVADGLKEAGSMNPVMVLDEVDKMGRDSTKGDPTAALLEVLDPNQNHKFVDKFLGPEVPLDLSDVLFMVTANELENIPKPLRDRMDVIMLDGYDLDEKLIIANNHLIKKVSKKLGFEKGEFPMTDAALELLIERYTRESGVRSLERFIDDVAEELIMRMEEGENIQGKITPQLVEELLGPPIELKPEKKPAEVGRGHGLVVKGDGIGGEVMDFYCTVAPVQLPNPEAPAQIDFAAGTPSRNMLEMTHDSVNHALQWIRSGRGQQKLKELGFDLAAQKGKRFELTVQTQRGGKVDGDSAGAVMTSAMVSALTGRKLRHDIAMTGTITILDEVLAIGGLRQKIRGAIENGTRVVLFPAENLRNEWLLLPEPMRAKLAMVDVQDFKKNPDMPIPQGKKLIVVPVNNINDVLDAVLLPAEAAKSTGVKGQVEEAKAPPHLTVQFSGKTPERKPLSVVA